MDNVLEIGTTLARKLGREAQGGPAVASGVIAQAVVDVCRETGEALKQAYDRVNAAEERAVGAEERAEEAEKSAKAAEEALKEAQAEAATRNAGELRRSPGFCVALLLISIVTVAMATVSCASTTSLRRERTARFVSPTFVCSSPSPRASLLSTLARSVQHPLSFSLALRCYPCSILISRSITRLRLVLSLLLRLHLPFARNLSSSHCLLFRSREKRDHSFPTLPSARRRSRTSLEDCASCTNC
jgi:hypothetical protein